MIGHAGRKGRINTNLFSVEEDLFCTRSNPDLVALAVIVTEGTDKGDSPPFPRWIGRGLGSGCIGVGTNLRVLSSNPGPETSGFQRRPVKVSLSPLSPVVVLCMHSALLGGSEQTALLRRAWAQGLADGRLVFLPYDTMLFSLPYHNRSYPALGHMGPLREVYDAVLTISLESSPTDKAFEAAGANEKVAVHLETEQVGGRPTQGPESRAGVLLTHSTPSWAWPAAS